MGAGIETGRKGRNLVDWLLFSLRLLAVVVLYAFLAGVVFVVWQDLRSNAKGGLAEPQPGDSQDSVPRTTMSFPLSPEGTGTGMGECELTTETSIGRAVDNDIVLADDCVSGRHALVTFRQGCWWLRDLDSRNGTLLNGVAVGGPVVLRNMDAIRLGNTTLVLHIDPDLQSSQSRR